MHSLLILNVRLTDLDALLNPPHHAHPHVVLLRRGHDPLVEVFNLLVQPAAKLSLPTE